MTQPLDFANSDVMVRFEDCTPGDVFVDRSWSDGVCTSTVSNIGDAPAAIREIVLFELGHHLSPETLLYGEGFQMLAQYDGTIAQRRLFGSHGDSEHYRIAEAEGSNVVYNLAQLTDPDGSLHRLLAFTTCDRFNGQVRLSADRIEVVLDLEGTTLAPGESWMLEEFAYSEGADAHALFDRLAHRIQSHYPFTGPADPLTGWCSWYWFFEDVTETDILANLDAIRASRLDIRYVQIDDGYQARMGDWLIPRPEVADPARLCRTIADAGFEPAIWVAPFIAEFDSELFREHPDWFVQRPDGTPLPSDEISFGGWRSAPWYMLDTTHPEALDHLRHVFRTMRDEWGCHYFKLDATMWAALPGRRHDASATSVEAYRQGMRAVREAVGDECILLGANSPMWPSLGLFDAMRTTSDIDRTWDAVSAASLQAFRRGWQHGRLWVNDPDCLVLMNRPQDEYGLSGPEYDFHAATIMASGGSLLSGDDLALYDAARFERLCSMLPPTGIAARFEGIAFDTARIREATRELSFHFNWTDRPIRMAAPAGAWRDLWTGEPVASESEVEVAGHSARVLETDH